MLKKVKEQIILGESSKELEDYGYADYQTFLLDITDETEKQLCKSEREILKHSREIYIVSHEEAMLKAVASMIERNNQVLTEQLKALGILKD